MSKAMWVILIICLMFCISCDKSAILYQGTLKEVDFYVAEGWGTTRAWVLTFEDGMVYTITEQPRGGLSMGKIYEIYSTYEGYIRARQCTHSPNK